MTRFESALSVSQMRGTRRRWRQLWELAADLSDQELERIAHAISAWPGRTRTASVAELLTTDGEVHPGLALTRQVEAVGDAVTVGQLYRILSDPRAAGIERLRLFNNGGLRGIEACLADASALPALASLEIGGLNLDDDGLAQLVAGIDLPSLRHLDLERNRLTRRGAEALGHAASLATLRTLALFENQLGDDGAVALAQSTRLGQLVELNLGWNQIGPSGAGALALAGGLPHLSILDLSLNGIGDDGLASLGGSGSLTRLRLAETGITAAGVLALAEGEVRVRLEELCLAHNRGVGAPWVAAAARLGGAPKLSTLDLSGTGAGTAALAALADRRSFPSLRTLSLRECGLDGEAGRWLVGSELLQRLERLDVRGNAMGSDVVRDLAVAADGVETVLLYDLPDED